jgi:hypothetical protein
MEQALRSMQSSSVQVLEVPLSGCKAFGRDSPNDQTILSRVWHRLKAVSLSIDHTSF